MARTSTDDENEDDRDESSDESEENREENADDGDDAEGLNAESEEVAAPGTKNRAERRKEAVLARRKEGSSSSEAEPLDALPKDKNARAKALLKRRQEAAEKQAQIGLSAGEVVSDQLARAASRTGTWFQRNFKVIVAATLAVVGTTVAVIYYVDAQREKLGRASGSFAKALLAEDGLVFNDTIKDTRPEAYKSVDPTPTFSSYEDKGTVLLASYAAARDTGFPSVVTLATLGEAGALLSQRKFTESATAYDAVLNSTLAAADVDLRGRALEGKGMALEGSGDLDGASQFFQKLEQSSPAFENLGRYHQGRIFLRKGDSAKAKELFTQVYKSLEIPDENGPKSPQLRLFVEEYLRGIDPALVPRKRPFGGPKGMPSPQEYERITREQERRAKQLEEEEAQREDSEH